MDFQNSTDFAHTMDEHDPLKSYRQEFLIPQHNDKDAIYFCGNSLGLQPRLARQYIDVELEDWAKLGVEGHFKGKNPWFYYHKLLKSSLANLTGADSSEVVPMATLTANLHFLMNSFYRPTQKRYKILIESGAFPSDHYAVESQLRSHGFDPNEALVEVQSKLGHPWLDLKDITDEIHDHRENLAMILLSGVQYYTGQFFNLKEIGTCPIAF